MSALRSRYGIAVLTLLLLALLSSCVTLVVGENPSPSVLPSPMTASPEISSPSPSPDESPAPVQNSKIRVSSTEEFIRAIGSDRTIVLSPGEYILPDDGEISMQGLEWESEPLFDNPAVTFAEDASGIGLTVTGVQNLTITGEPGGFEAHGSLLYSTSRFAAGIVFTDCKNLKIGNMALGHSTDADSPYGYLIMLNRCENVEIIDSALYCNGTHAGIGMDKSSGVRLEDVALTGFEGFAGVWVRESRDVVFSDCDFSNGRGEMLFAESQNITFEGCSFFQCDGDVLFDGYDCENVIVRHTDFRANKYLALTDEPLAVIFRDVTFTGGNAFESVPGFGFDSQGRYTGDPFMPPADPAMYYEDELIAAVRSIETEPGLSFTAESTDFYENEPIYVIRVYYDMENHIATVAWYYGGRETGRIWHYDVATDKVTLVYDIP